MRVDVSGKQFAFPRQCACCGRFPGTWLTISGTERNRNSKTRGWAWDIPYCHQCRTHVRVADRLLIAALSLVALLGVGSFVALGLGAAWYVSFAAFLLGSALASIGVAWLFARLKRSQFAGCVALIRSVRYLGSSGSWHSFDIRSRTYVSAFVRANRLKLVNASASIRSMLREQEMSEFQVARRITRGPK
jgi:hypothetical protein